MRLIDAEYLKEHVFACATNGRPLHHMELSELFDAIDDVSTIEPERKTGKWEEENGSLWKDNRRTRWGCSACGKHVLITLYDNPIKAGLMFCPNCGAKMEETE